MSGNTVLGGSLIFVRILGGIKKWKICGKKLLLYSNCTECYIQHEILGGGFNFGLGDFEGVRFKP